VVALLAALETRYKVSIPPEDVDAEGFDTPTQILAAIQRQKA
jgi:acyl carrier protein